MCVCACLRSCTVALGQWRVCTKQDGWGNHEVAQGAAEYPSQAYPTTLLSVKNKCWQFPKMLQGHHDSRNACFTQIDLSVPHRVISSGEVKLSEAVNYSEIKNVPFLRHCSKGPNLGTFIHMSDLSSHQIICRHSMFSDLSRVKHFSHHLSSFGKWRKEATVRANPSGVKKKLNILVRKWKKTRHSPSFASLFEPSNMASAGQVLRDLTALWG
jgi:hypothetical protein